MLNRAVEILYRALERLARSLVPVEAALEVKLVSLRVLRVALGDEALFRRS